MNIIEKFENLGASGVVRLMVEVLRNPIIPVRMNTFGNIILDGEQEICVGCAATNSLMKLCNLTNDDAYPYLINENVHRRLPMYFGKENINDIAVNDQFNVSYIENVIDHLRTGDIESANLSLTKTVITWRFPDYNNELPILRTEYTEALLKHYIGYADYIDSLKN